MFDSEFERSLFELRKSKLAEIEKLGQLAYPNRFPDSDAASASTIPEIRARWGEALAEDLDANRTIVLVAGRIMAIRAQGKAGFATLQQGGERLQIYVRLDAVGDRLTHFVTGLGTTGTMMGCIVAFDGCRRTLSPST